MAQKGLSYVSLPSSPLAMSREEACYYLDGRSWAVIVRSLLIWELERVQALREAGETIEPRTLRSLWYTLIKPSLEKLGALDKSYYTVDRVKPKDVGKIPDWDGLTSKYLSQLVERGITSYEELGIIDGSRPRQAPQGQYLPIESVPILGVHYPNIILFTEKDTIYPILQGVASLYGISVISGSGNPAYAATENLLRQMVRHSKFATGSNIYVLTLTDYDPAGYDISKALVDQVAKVTQTLRPKTGAVQWQRLGLEPRQLTPEERRQNAYTPAKDKKLPKWLRETGGIDGQPLGLELDALPASRIRGMFVDGIRQIIHDERPYHRDLAQALVDLLIWEAIEPEVEAMRERVRHAISADELANNLRCSRDVVASFAKAGYSHIDPLEQDSKVFSAAEAIREKLRLVAN